MSKYSQLAERLVPRLPGGDITVPTVQTVVDAAAALRELEDEVSTYRALLDQLLYYNDGRWYVGLRGDVDVTDLVGKYLKVEEQ